MKLLNKGAQYGLLTIDNALKAVVRSIFLEFD